MIEVQLSDNIPMWENLKVFPKEVFVRSVNKPKQTWNPETKRYVEENTKKIVHNEVPDAEVYHKNYLDYLRHAWGNHFGVVFAPHYVWYAVLCEIAGHIKENSKHYSGHFTTTPDAKQAIVLPQTAPYPIELDRLVEELKKKVPMNTDLLLPTFSTSTTQSIFATYAAFADAMSPYYQYYVLLCDLPKIRLEGTKEDWMKIKNSLDELQVLDLAKPWLTKVSSLVSDIAKNYETPDPDFWRGMFSVKRCGSGHQAEVAGWITSLYMHDKGRAQGRNFVENFATHISRVDYKVIGGKEYSMFHGLFSSKVDDEYLVPEFSFFVEEK